MKTLLSFSMIALLAASGNAQPAPQESGPQEEIVKLFHAQGLDQKYLLASHLKPSSLRGDFTGDGKPDTAILVKERKTGKTGIALCNSGSNAVFVIGAGKDFGNGGDDFGWMDGWALKAKTKLHGKIAALSKGDALFVEKQESASALIYWNGSKYVWRQQGD